ncbi:DnaD domain-containing protein [Limosilactobacillus pulli]|uniref:DnaD domain-containing protein n=1 Tax=Limosilactobacillus pulli TaxID=2991833 RepID=UPI0024B9977D|nr:DnaD domain protein [Limosilactobacillus pulli]
MVAQDFLFSYLQAGETSISNLLLHHYREIGMTSGELLVYLELKSYIDRGIENPSITWIAENLQTDERIVYEQIHQMTEHQLLVQRMKRDEEGKETAYYDFSPMINRLVGRDGQIKSQQTTVKKATAREKLFKEIESEFGRPLTPMEITYVNDWLDKDHYDLEMVRLALKEAVVNGSLRFRYMDSILLNWRKNNLKTPQEVEQDKQRYQSRQIQQGHQSKRPIPNIPIFKLPDD